MSADTREIKITRTIAAPVRKVFEAWTDAALLRKWLAPRPYEVSEAEADGRPGGRYKIVVATADDGPHTVTGEYLEIEPDRRIVKTWVYEGPRASEAIPSLLTVEFREIGPEATELTLTHSEVPPEQLEEGTAGWNLILDRLGEVLAD